jgi:polyisoprenoid-binding protein YceI
MSIDTVGEQIPTGNWQVERVHSTVGFAVKYTVSTFRTRFADYDAELTVAENGSLRLVGTVDPRSIAILDDNLAAHLQTPDFFDSERYPELRFEATNARRNGDEIVFDGELTIKDHTHPVEARGTISGPAIALGDVEKIGLELTAVVDRTKFGLDWNAPLPRGGLALANEVTLSVDLQLVRA